VRRGDHVLRPSNPHTPTIHRYLRELRSTGFDGVSEPVGVDPDGRERLVFIPGDVAFPPFPDWAQADDALASVAELLRRFHDASAAVDPTGDWSDEMADADGGPMVIHNDVCLENVVFRDGRAIALIDFDFAAPGRPVSDLAKMIRLCGPVDDDVSAAGFGWHAADRAARARVAADAYGVDRAGRAELLIDLDGGNARSGEFVRRRVEAGDPNFIAAWEQMGGQARFDRRRAWWAEQRPRFEDALA
jgi:aminoglycoside phosphotransferase (APT) family kinase protein